MEDHGGKQERPRKSDGDSLSSSGPKDSSVSNRRPVRSSPRRVPNPNRSSQSSNSGMDPPPQQQRSTVVSDAFEFIHSSESIAVELCLSEPKVSDSTGENQEQDTEDESYSSFDVIQQKIILDAILGSSANLSTHSPGKKAANSMTSGVINTMGNSRSWNPRDRLESWGGMSDVSHPFASVAQLNMVHSASLQDVEEYMNDESSVVTGKCKHPKKRHKGLHTANDEDDPAVSSKVPVKIFMETTSDKTRSRDRLDSISSFPGFFSRDRLDSLASLGDASMNMTLTEQLADLAGTLENVVGGLESVESCNSSVSNTYILSGLMSNHRHRFESIAESSMASSNLYEEDHASDGPGARRMSDYEDDGKSTGALHLPNAALLVDPDAVQAAVEAAMAVTGKLDLFTSQSNFESTLPPRSGKKRHNQKRSLPSWASTLPGATPIMSNRRSDTTIQPIILPPSFIPSIPVVNQSSDAQIEAMRARARAAAGYVHPSDLANAGVANILPPRNPPTGRSRSRSNQSHAQKNAAMTQPPTESTSADMIEDPTITTSDEINADSRPSLPPLKKRATFALNQTGESVLNTPNATILSTHSQSTTPKRNNLRVDSDALDETCTVESSNTSEIPNDASVPLPRKRKSKFPTVLDSTGGLAVVLDGPYMNHPISFIPCPSERENLASDEPIDRGLGYALKSSGQQEIEQQQKRRNQDTGENKTSNQKWEEMFEALLQYKKEVTETETASMTEDEKNEWVWSGNVPTHYKTSNGKALGRWVNNQRQAKTKGMLKTERENRLVDSGLKWSVISTNGWTDMVNELRAYVCEKNKDGKEWDGNVPTAYKTTSNTAPDGTEIDEDKNLGRWVNRQRCLYQTGKLKKERQLELESIGLKWVVLANTSWSSMYDALCIYVEKRKSDGTWDGIVPVCFETDDSPPKKLGKWINRQRNAYISSRLKDEFFIKFKDMGIKWADGSVKKLAVEKGGNVSAEDPGDDDDNEDADAEVPVDVEIVDSSRDDDHNESKVYSNKDESIVKENPTTSPNNNYLSIDTENIVAV